jgi:hypothetical protein
MLAFALLTDIVVALCHGVDRRPAYARVSGLQAAQKRMAVGANK